MTRYDVRLPWENDPACDGVREGQLHYLHGQWFRVSHIVEALPMPGTVWRDSPPQWVVHMTVIQQA